jgi:hypothetical protein
MAVKRTNTLTLEGGGQGGGEIVARCFTPTGTNAQQITPLYDLTSPATPSPSRGGRS